MSDRPVKDLYEKWLAESGTPEGADLVALRIAWYNGVSTILNLHAEDDSTEMYNLIMNDINLLHEEISEVRKNRKRKAH